VQRQVHSFSKNIRDELRCTPPEADIEGRQRTASAIENHGEPTEHQMVQKARVPGILALANPTSGKKCKELSIRDMNATFNIRRSATLKTIPEVLTQCNFAGQHLRLEVYKETLKLIAGGRI
jgi:hypothetical protein